jgi:hypothetical protein
VLVDADTVERHPEAVGRRRLVHCRPELRIF